MNGTIESNLEVTIMRILTKSLSVVAAASLAALILFAAFGWFFILKLNHEIEIADSVESFTRARVQVDRLLNAHAKSASDYGIWHDAYDFMAENSPAFVERNLGTDPFENLSINFLAYYLPDGTHKWKFGYDYDANTEIPWPIAIDEEVRRTPTLLHSADDTTAHSGFLDLGGKLTLIATQPVMKARREFPVAGTVMFGRYLTQGDLDAIAQAIGAHVTIETTVGTACKSSDGCYETQFDDKKLMRGSGTLFDIRGRPVATLRLEMPRTVWQLGLSHIHKFLTSAVIGVMVIATMIFVFLRLAILAPLLDLLRRIRRIGPDKILPATSRRRHETQKDEIDEIESALAEALQSLRDAEQSLLSEMDKKAESERLAMIGDFAAGLIHEINNPAMVALERTRMVLLALESATHPNPKAKANAEKTMASIERMVTVTQAMELFSSEPDTKKHSVIDLVDVVNRAIGVREARLNSLEIKLHKHIEPAEAPIVGAPYLIEKAVANLIQNALVAVQTVQTHSERWIRVSMTKDDSRVRLVVADSGPTIHPKIQDNLMRPFFAPGSSERGSGLTLSLVYQIAVHHRGRFEFIKSEPHTTFLIEWPVAPPSALAEKTALSPDDALKGMLAGLAAIKEFGS